jgi:predicted nuclease of predicted toxin-antitoxin system
MRLLLDIHIDPTVATVLKADGIDVASLRDWREGDDREASDEVILAEAREEQRVLVTYDKRTVPPIVRRWTGAGQTHAGVIIVDRRTVPQEDIGGLIRALRAFVSEHGESDWSNRLDYLRPPRF